MAALLKQRMEEAAGYGKAGVKGGIKPSSIIC